MTDVRLTLDNKKMKWNLFNNKIGLALGGGAGKGIAHIGVLKVFEEKQIEVSCISGTSIGALVAAYFAFGKPVEEIKKVGADLTFSKMVGFSIQKQGVFSTKSIREMILRDLGDKRIEDALIPLAICTSDIFTGEKVVHTRGSVVDAVCASVAVPGIFVPVEIDGRTLVDGGITENVPVSALETLGAGITIGVDLNGVNQYQEPKDMIAIMGNAIDIAIDQRTKDQLRSTDVVLSMDLADYSRLGNPEQFEPLYQYGYDFTHKKLRRLFWYKRLRVLYYLRKIIVLLMPLKVPAFIKEPAKATYKKLGF